MKTELASTPQADSPIRDRYCSFVGLDCSGQAQRLVALLRPYIDDPARTNGFWQLFARKLAAESGPKHDALFLIHAHLNILREQLEMHDDETALALLDQIEIECC
ncbi:N(2)-fixation sustaining protein CowN [Niveibacterium sp.]|uniref:N(2)-fixation sustaining protein CowN n=1 Tax=Niveibacterium sp. TaxID=2017444 RepID=UPI0035B4A188